jgi:hypothetical protein
MPLLEISRYVYGTTRLGDAKIPFEDRVRIASEAIQAGCWIHTSNQYGNALEVLRAAFDLERDNVPPAIFKIGWDSVEQIREQIRVQIDALAISSMSVGQLCLNPNMGEQLRTGGPGVDQLLEIKAEGLAESFVLEVWPWNSTTAFDALQGGHAQRLLDGFIFYLNPLQRFVTNELWDLILASPLPIVAMRTVAGGTVYPSERAPEYLRKRAAEVAPLFERSGSANWTEFCVRYALGFGQVLTTVGSTARSDNLNEFLTASKSPEPLPAEIVDEILSLQRRWSDEHDRHAEPWSM